MTRTISNSNYATKLIISLDLMELSIEIKRQQLKRAHPDESEAKINELLQYWLDDSDSIERTKS